MMFSGKGMYYIPFIFFLLLVTAGIAQNTVEEEKPEPLDLGIRLLERYFDGDDTWQPEDPETSESVRGLIRFIEKQPIDSIIRDLDLALKDTARRFVYRLPVDVSDSLEVPGYFPRSAVNEEIAAMKSELETKYFENELPVPVDLISDIENNANVIPSGQGRRLFTELGYNMPDSLQIPDIVPDSLMQSPDDFNRFVKLDSIRDSYIEEMRQAYNDSVVQAYRDSVVADYHQRQFDREFTSKRRRFLDSVKANNYEVLKNYNDSVMLAVNDSISLVVENLSEYADLIDTTRITVTNLFGEESSILFQKDNELFSRIWLKNKQNDSLRLMARTLDKRSVQLLIDDGVTFSRFKVRESKDFDFRSLSRGMGGLTNVGKKYQVLTPWIIGGDGSVGFTQTYLENWKKGGQSALSLLIVLKGYANYSRDDGKVKWENSGEIRNGYLRPGGEGSELQKNDDKFEVTSRFGVSAFKRWYYSTEFNYETQLFNGYKYPTADNPDPISAFMAPARTFFKLGLDYKPNNNFSLFLSPLTAKNVFVKDTMKIDQTKFGIERGKRSFWEPGLNADVSFKKALTPEITYETKYKMFINYKEPFGNLDINWENLLVARLTDRINMRMLVHLIYDEDILFPEYDANDVQIGEKPKLQVKEFITVGFSYRINKQVTRTRRMD